MPPIDPTVVLVILWVSAGVLMAWTWIPALIAALGGTRYRNGCINDPENLQPGRNEPDYAYWYRQLQTMGYTPLGRGWVRIDFAGQDWSLYFVVRVFYHAPTSCFAVLQRVPPPFSIWPGVFFATCFTDDILLFTDNNEAATPVPDDDFIRQGTVSLNLATVEELHLATLAALNLRGLRTDTHADIETLFHAMQTHVGPRFLKHHGHHGMQYFFAHLLIHICVSTPAALLIGIGHWSVPLSNLVLAGAMLLGERMQKSHYGRMVRAAMREKMADQTKQTTESTD